MPNKPLSHNRFVERIAAAIWESRQDECTWANALWCVANTPSGTTHTYSWLIDTYRQTAKAALLGMREPTEAMLAAAYAARSDPQYNVAPYITIWQAMIDEALK